MLILLHGGKVLNLLGQNAAKATRSARVLAVTRGDAGVGEHAATQVGLKDTQVNRLEHGVPELLQVHAVCTLTLLRAHEPVLKDERKAIALVVVRALDSLLRDQTRHALLGDGTHQVVVEVHLIPGDLVLPLSHAEWQSNATRPQVVLSDETNHHCGQEGVAGVVVCWGL